MLHSMLGVWKIILGNRVVRNAVVNSCDYATNYAGESIQRWIVSIS